MAEMKSAPAPVHGVIIISRTVASARSGSDNFRWVPAHGWLGGGRGTLVHSGSEWVGQGVCVKEKGPDIKRAGTKVEYRHKELVPAPQAQVHGRCHPWFR